MESGRYKNCGFFNKRDYEINKIMKKILVLAILSGTLASCSSAKPTRNKAKERAKRVMTPRPQFAIVNNQIIIFENNL
jgi:hypothetical protein